jgi:hypothetical protein
VRPASDANWEEEVKSRLEKEREEGSDFEGAETAVEAEAEAGAS